MTDGNHVAVWGKHRPEQCEGNKLDIKELVKLLEASPGEPNSALDDVSIHSLAAGRCAGSYGCGMDFFWHDIENMGKEDKRVVTSGRRRERKG